MLLIASFTKRHRRSISPKCEDNRDQAKQRLERANSVAVNYDWVIKESAKTYPVRMLPY